MHFEDRVCGQIDARRSPGGEWTPGGNTPHIQHCISRLAASYCVPVTCTQVLLPVDHCGETAQDWTKSHMILTSFPT